MTKKLEQLVSRLKMSQTIMLLCAQSFIFTLLLGIYVILKSKSMLSATEYIYSYQEYSQLLGTIESDFLSIKGNFMDATTSYDSKYAQDIEHHNKSIIDSIAIYNSTEYEEEWEETQVQSIDTASQNYYSIVQEYLPQLAEGKTVSPEVFKRLDSIETEFIGCMEELKEYISYWADSDMNDLEESFHILIRNNLFFFTFSMLFICFFGFLTIRVFNRQTKEINEALLCTSEGDLTSSLQISNTATEFNQMKSSLQQALSNFLHILSSLKNDSSVVEMYSNDLRSSSVALTGSIQNITESIESVRCATEEQAADINSTLQVLSAFTKDLEQFTNSIECLSANSKEVSDIANTSTQKMDQVSLSIAEVNTLITSFFEKFVLLSDAVNEIYSITNFINTISAQTNLLALNASIESARVGEAGKGFAVVASEIGQLAEQSKEASNTISDLIRQIASDTEAIKKDSANVKDKLALSTTTIEDSLSSFKPMFKLLDEMVTKITSLSSASSKIVQEKEDIYSKIIQTSQIANTISESAESISQPLADINKVSSKVSDTSNELYNLTNNLNANIQHFKTTKEDI